MEMSQSLWETRKEIDEEALYPAKHPFIRTTTDTHDPNKTPYSVTTSSYPLYKKNYMHFILNTNEEPPVGFKHNCGTDYIHYLIMEPYGKTAQAQYVQVIMGPNPIVIGLRNDTNKVYSKPLYAHPIYHFDGKLVYTMDELGMLLEGAEESDKMDQMIERVGDVSLTAEVRQFRAITAEVDRVALVLQENERVWGELATAKLGSIRHLEMADTLAQIKDQDDRLLDDALRSMREFLERQKHWGHRF